MRRDSSFMLRFEPRFNYAVAVVLLLLICGNVSRAQDTNPTPSPCEPERLNTSECLNAVRQLMADEDKFWFGTNYSLTCPPGSFSTACINYDPMHLSILTRVRQDNDSSVDGIQQVLNVTFRVPRGSYESCGNTYTVEALTQTIDPVRTATIPLWSADHVPHVSWSSQVDKLYTLIVWDAGSCFLHGVMYNIRGSNLENAQTAWNYRGPKNSMPREQPYVFLLYEQNAEIEEMFIKNHLIAALSRNSRNMSPNDITGPLNLTGPVGVSVLRVFSDPYAAGYMKRSRIINICPTLLSPKFAALPLSYNFSSAVLMSSVDVTFATEDIVLRSCCSERNVRSNSRVANPLGDGLIQAVYTRIPPRVNLVPISFFDSFYYLHLHLTLLMLDVTDELNGSPRPNTVLHWQVINIREGDVMSGETTQSYKAPLPLNRGGQRVILFLLLRQSAMVNGSDLIRFTGGDSCSLPGTTDRCRFNMTAFITEHAMTIEGASWFKASPDAYSRRQTVTLGLESENEACRGVSGYANPCPTCTGGSEVKRVSLGLIFVFQLLTLSRAVF